MTKLEERLNQLAEKIVTNLDGRARAFDFWNYGLPVDHETEMSKMTAIVREEIKSLILEMPELKALVEGVNGLQKEYVVGSDGTRIKCACGREGCIEFWCSAGDVIYTSSYTNKVHPHVAITKWRSFIGEESETL